MTASVPPGPPGPGQKLPIACDRCRKRKQKCDRSIPSCRRCAMANARCTLTNSNQAVSIGGRGYVEQLEHKLQLLQERLRNTDVTSPIGNSHHSRANGNFHPLSERNELEEQARHNREQPQRQATAHHDSPLAHLTIAAMAREGNAQHAINFTLSTSLHSVSSCNGSMLTHSPGPESLSSLPTGMFGDPRSTNLSHVMANIPRAEALRFIDSYFHSVHPLFPCSDRPSIVEMFLHVSMRPAEAYQKVEELISVVVVALGMMACGNGSEAQFLVDCVASQASSYFTASLDALLHTQALVLLSVLSLVQPRAGLTWHYIGLTINRVIALGLHRLPTLPESALGTEAASSHQKHVVLLWSAYCLDRLSSLALGKPFSFQDCDITTPRPTLRRGVQEFPDIIRLVTLLSEIRRAQGHNSNHLYYQLQLWKESSHPPQYQDGQHWDIQSSTAYTHYCEMLYLRGLLLLFETNPARFQIGSATASEVMSSCEKMINLAHSWTNSNHTTQQPPLPMMPPSWITGCFLFSAGVIYLHIVVRDPYARSRHTLADFLDVVSRCGATLGTYAQVFGAIRHHRDAWTELGRAVSVFLERELRARSGGSFEQMVHTPVEKCSGGRSESRAAGEVQSLRYITDASARSMIEDIFDAIPEACAAANNSG